MGLRAQLRPQRGGVPRLSDGLLPGRAVRPPPVGPVLALLRRPGRGRRAGADHCAAGRDRTGILAALTHHLIGVHPDDIVADYLLTNEAIAFEQRMPLMMQAIAEGAGREPTQAAVRVAMGVDAAFLEAALAAIKASHGAIDDYPRTALGVDPALRAKVEARLVG